MKKGEGDRGREKCLEWEVFAIQSPDRMECERGDQCGIPCTHRNTHSDSQMFFSQWGRSGGLVSLGQPTCVWDTHTHLLTVKIWPIFLSSAVTTFTVSVCQNSLFYQWKVHVLQFKFLYPRHQHCQCSSFNKKLSFLLSVTAVACKSTTTTTTIIISGTFLINLLWLVRFARKSRLFN